MGKTIVEPDISKLNDFLAKSLEEMVAEYLSLNKQERKDLLLTIPKRLRELEQPAIASWNLHRQQLRFLERENDLVWKELLGTNKLDTYLQTFLNEETAIAAAHRGQNPTEEDQINITQKVKGEWHLARKVIRWSSDIAQFLKSDIEGMLGHLKNNLTTRQSRLEWRDVVNRFIKENKLWAVDTWNTLSDAYDFVEEVINDPQYGKKTWLYDYLKQCKVYADLRHKFDLQERDLENCRRQSDALEPCQQNVEKLQEQVKVLYGKIDVHEKTIAGHVETIKQLQAYAPIINKPLEDAERINMYVAYQGLYLRSVDR